jgi:hypothetical protein
MATLVVGPGQSIAAAVAAANSGDTIDVITGTYTNDFVTIDKSRTLQAIGGPVVMVGTVDSTNDKGIINEGGPGITVIINGFDISGATVRDDNGAGIRYGGGSLILNKRLYLQQPKWPVG